MKSSLYRVAYLFHSSGRKKLSGVSSLRPVVHPFVDSLVHFIRSFRCTAHLADERHAPRAEEEGHFAERPALSDVEFHALAPVDQHRPTVRLKDRRTTKFISTRVHLFSP